MSNIIYVDILIAFYIRFFQFSSTAIHRHVSHFNIKWLNDNQKMSLIIVGVQKKLIVVNYQNTPSSPRSASKAKAVRFSSVRVRAEFSLHRHFTAGYCVCVLWNRVRARSGTRHSRMSRLYQLSPSFLSFFWAKAVSY